MTDREHSPFGSTLRRRIEAFYELNPHEWLTWEDICTKFDCSKDQARNALQALRDDGRVVWEVVSVIRLKDPDA